MLPMQFGQMLLLLEPPTSLGKETAPEEKTVLFIISDKNLDSEPDLQDE